MRRFIITVYTLLLVVSGTTYSEQLNTSEKTPVLRHVQGMKGIGLQGGRTAFGGEGIFVVDYYFSPQWKLSVALGREADTFKYYKYQSFFLQPLVGYTLYKHPKYFVFRALGGINLQGASLPTKKQMRQGEERTYESNIGLVGGGEIELFLTKHISSVLSGGLRRFYWEACGSKNDYFLHLGFRLSL